MFSDIKNNIDFYIRNLTRFSRKNFVEKNAERLKRNEAENRYITDILEKYFSKNSKKDLRILDIGCKNWFYAKGEYKYFQSFCKNVYLEGIELDAYRLYSNFYNRYETAKFYIKDLPNTKYIADNLLNLKDKYDYITWILPFVVPEPHEYWGLPKKYFYPEKLLAHAYSLLNPQGQMLIINQGEVEFNTQKELLNKLNISYKELGKINSPHFEYKYTRFGILVTKT